MPTSTNLAHELAQLADHWSPRVVGRVNDQYVKVAKVKGELAWHQHDEEDELFLVVRGQLVIQLRDGDVRIGPGEFYVVPRGTPHNPVADEECWIMLVETVTTQHTGDVRTPLTRSIEEQLGGRAP
jgi:quercetin dioxygenase-like cupin family protein